jgi:endonuclease/exonuclease/phosphatase family metal-dependent hydrolase
MEERFTSRFKKKMIILDHILLNRNLTPHLLPRGAAVCHSREAEKASDHFPIYIDLTP